MAATSVYSTRRFLLKSSDGRLLRPRQLKLHDCWHSELHDYCYLKTLNYRDGNFRCFDFVNFIMYTRLFWYTGRILGTNKQRKKKKGEQEN